ncbi:MAG: hypothetical protein EWM73_03494 [Nitrospira sp.]|nr:MAG: hypothetical protein EWM73_03494 [Nitrospira sp.]
MIKAEAEVLRGQVIALIQSNALPRTAHYCLSRVLSLLLFRPFNSMTGWPPSELLGLMGRTPIDLLLTCPRYCNPLLV